MKMKPFVIAIIVFFLALTGNFNYALAGCGCDKPLPLPAPVIPSAIYPGMPVNLYSDNFIAEEVYTVRFGEMVDVTGTADMDREGRMRVRVTLPQVSIGPTPIEVKYQDQVVLSIPSSEFTVVSSPYVLPGEGSFKYSNQRLAVDTHGIIYISFHMSNVIEAVGIKAWLRGYGLRIDDFVILNVQGYNMETVGLQRIQNLGKSQKSDKILYDRHTFQLYYENHAERLPHQIDPDDPDYHLDGTRHIDHDRLILAISGHFNDGTMPIPGATPELGVKLILQKEDEEAGY
jgi:hypothetical protein